MKAAAALFRSGVSHEFNRTSGAATVFDILALQPQVCLIDALVDTCHPFSSTHFAGFCIDALRQG